MINLELDDLDLESPFYPHYITPIRIYYEFGINSNYPKSMEEVIDSFKESVKNNILKAVDKGFKWDDRFEFSDDWYQLSDKDKLNWYRVFTGNMSNNLNYRKLNTILAALHHFETYCDDDPGLQEAFFYDCDRLSTDEIKNLCAFLNSNPSSLM